MILSLGVINMDVAAIVSSFKANKGKHLATFITIASEAEHHSKDSRVAINQYAFLV